MDKKKKKVTAIAASCCAIALTAGIMMGMGPGGGGGMGGGMGGPGGEEDGFSASTVVEVQTPQSGTIVVTGEFVGTVEPGQQTTVYPKAAGEVIAANFAVGDVVTRGEVLFQIDSTTVQLNIAQQQANLASSQAQAELNLQIAQRNLDTYYEQIDEGYNSTLMSAENQVANAETSLQSANNSLRSARSNYSSAISNSDGDYSDAQVEQYRQARVSAELQVESAQLALEQARANLEAVQSQVANQALTQYDSVLQAEINSDFTSQYISIQQLQNTLSDYTVTAPISGVIEQVNIDLYDMASTQTAAYVISNKDAMSVTFSVAESALTYMTPGNAVTIDKNGEQAAGVISEVSTMVDASSGLYTIKATVQDAPFELHSGSIIKVYADTQRVEDEMMVPIDSIYYDNGSPYVYTFADNTAHKVYVETGISDTENIQITSGLTWTDQVIVTWSSSLYEGAAVYLPGTAPAAADGGGDALPEGIGVTGGERPGDQPEGFAGAPDESPGTADSFPEGLDLPPSGEEAPQPGEGMTFTAPDNMEQVDEAPADDGVEEEIA